MIRRCFKQGFKLNKFFDKWKVEWSELVSCDAILMCDMYVADRHRYVENAYLSKDFLTVDHWIRFYLEITNGETKMVVHIISVGLTGFYFYLAKPASDLFSWHPVCMSMAFVLLMLQAIMIFSTESSLTPTSPRPDKIQVLTNETRTTLGFKSIYLCTKHGTKYLIPITASLDSSCIWNGFSCIWFSFGLF